jgi:hypothetical protein
VGILTAEEIKTIEFKIAILERCRKSNTDRSGLALSANEEYYRGMENGLKEILQEFGSADNT